MKTCCWSKAPCPGLPVERLKSQKCNGLCGKEDPLKEFEKRISWLSLK
jgi:hypothetical protein